MNVRWGMVIDLRRCIGCGACALVCGQANKMPTNLWRRVFDCGISEAPERQRTCMPMNCMHCGEPSCLDVCPTAATFRRPDGIIDINYELCIGCGYCIAACPYMARSIVFENEYDPEPDRIGVCSKCNFCFSRIESGLRRGLKPGVDQEASPMCVISCTANALYFGDLNDPESNVSVLTRENKTVLLQEQLGTDPSVYYIVD